MLHFTFVFKIYVNSVNVFDLHKLINDNAVIDVDLNIHSPKYSIIGWVAIILQLCILNVKL